MNTTCVDPHEVTRLLQETIARYVGLGQVSDAWPPGAMQVAQAILLAQLAQILPVLIGNAKPFRVSRALKDIILKDLFRKRF